MLSRHDDGPHVVCSTISRFCRCRGIAVARDHFGEACSSVARATSSVLCGTKWNAILRSSAIIVGEMQAWQPRNGLLPARIEDRSRRALGEEVGRRGRNYFGRMTPQIVENFALVLHRSRLVAQHVSMHREMEAEAAVILRGISKTPSDVRHLLRQRCRLLQQ